MRRSGCSTTDAIGANGDLVFDVEAEVIARAKTRLVQSHELYEGRASA